MHSDDSCPDDSQFVHHREFNMTYNSADKLFTLHLDLPLSVNAKWTILPRLLFEPHDPGSFTHDLDLTLTPTLIRRQPATMQTSPLCPSHIFAGRLSGEPCARPRLCPADPPAQNRNDRISSSSSHCPRLFCGGVEPTQPSTAQLSPWRLLTAREWIPAPLPTFK